MATDEKQGTGMASPARRFSHLIFDTLPTNYVHSKYPNDKLVEDVKDQDIVCVPSMSMDANELLKVAGVIHYEERSLFATLFLRHPTTRLIFLTSAPMDERIVQYYLSLLGDISALDVMNRLVFLSTNDFSHKPLSVKIMERPRLIARIKSLIRPGKGCMLCFNTTQAEQDLAAKLEVTLIGCDPKYNYLGSKSGSRSIFQACNVPHPAGVPLAHSVEKIAASICELVRTKHVSAMVVKLDEGFSGHGNALLDLSPLANNSNVTPDDIISQLSKMNFSSASENWNDFKKKIEVLGAIAEEYIVDEAASPSVQGYITLSGDVELLSTHDQMLKGQIYQGCVFPATDKYRMQINKYGAMVGEVLAKQGARGYFGVDFLVPKNSDSIYALEINLRLCGTTHPYFTMKLLTGGSYDKKTAMFYSNKGILKFYRATDNMHKPQYKGLLPADMLDIASLYDIRYSSTTQSGIVFHLLGAMSEHGKIGYTAIGDSPEEAENLYKKVEDALDRETSQMNMGLSMGEKMAPKIYLSPRQNVLTFRGKTESKADLGRKPVHIFVTTCIHGDEVCGMHAVNELINDQFFDNLPIWINLTIMCGNPLAVQKGVRYVDQNLNRSILPHLFETGGYETFRARTIANHIFDADVYLDIHSTSSPSPAMCLPAANSTSEDLSRKLPVDYVVEELAHATEVRGTTIDWAYFHHKTAVSVECGQHSSNEAVQVAKRVLRSLVEIYSGADSAQPQAKQAPNSTPQIMRCVGREKVAAGFNFTETIPPFSHIKKGKIIAQDNSGPILCPYDFYKEGALVIMPTAKPYEGEEALFWAVPCEK